MSQGIDSLAGLNANYQLLNSKWVTQDVGWVKRTINYG